MNNIDKKLSKFFIEPISRIKDKSLTSIKLNNVSDDSVNDFSDSGLNIVVEAIFCFEGNMCISFSWLGYEGWPQYVLGSFSEPVYENNMEVEVSKFDQWQKYIGKTLSSYELFGYKDDKQQTHSMDGKLLNEVEFSNQPHLIRLNFEGYLLSLANFSYEEDLIPKFPCGDDLWIFFEPENVEGVINNHEFDVLLSVQL